VDNYSRSRVQTISFMNQKREQSVDRQSTSQNVTAAYLSQYLCHSHVGEGEARVAFSCVRPCTRPVSARTEKKLLTRIY